MLNHTGSVVLETDRLILRKFQLNDAENMFINWAASPEVTRYVTWFPHSSVEISRNVIEAWIDEYQEPDYYQWAIVLKERGDDPIGSISVVAHDDRLMIAHIGYCIGRRWWHRGIMTESLQAVIGFLFDAVGVMRIESRHDPRNPHSGAVMRKCGMQYEGTMRKSDINNQGFCDASWYAIQAEDRR